MHSHEVGPKVACTYNVGDLVWAKVRSHPWWPAQIFNVAFASDLAKRHQKPGQVLVAFFGDQKFAWLKSSNILALEPNFEALAGRKRTRTFSFALEELFYEIRRRAELSITCMCSKIFKQNIGKGMEAGLYASCSQYQLNTRINKRDLDVYKMVKFIKEVGCLSFGDYDPNIETAVLHGYALGIRNRLCKANAVMDNANGCKAFSLLDVPRNKTGCTKCDNSKDEETCFRMFQKEKRQFTISLSDDEDVGVRRRCPRIDHSDSFRFSFGHSRSALFDSSQDATSTVSGGWCNGIDGEHKFSSVRNSDDTPQKYDMHELLLVTLKQKSGDNKGSLLGTNAEKTVEIISESTNTTIQTCTDSPSHVTEKMHTSELQIATANKHVSSQTCTCLFIKFPPNYQLPSEKRLNSMFMPFGALQTDQTRVWKDTGSAQVVFEQGHDAEIAYKYAKENMVSDKAKITFRLRHFSNS